MEIGQAIDSYFELAGVIHEYFGYKEDWVVIPLDDQRQMHWFVTLDEVGKGSGRCVYSDEPFSVESIEAGSKIYSGEIYTQRFLPKWVYRGEAFTLVSVDTQVDRNKFLMIFDNAKEQNDPAFAAAYREFWS